jgi:signal transduction histidine kinase/DNA-binding response OmpR family regulator/sugar lactone lactonase YvrE
MGKLLLSVVVVFFSAVVNAQLVPIYSNFDHYDTEDGLPQNYVSSIVQDKDGFIWVSTLDGIARFDGHTFLEFNISSDSTEKISTPRVIDLNIDSQNNLWILHYNSEVDVMNPRTFEVTRQVNPITSVHFDSFAMPLSYRSAAYFYFVEDIDNTLWFVKDKEMFHLYDSSNSQLTRLFGLSSSDISQAFGFDVDTKGRLWTLVQGGLKVSDENWTTFRDINAPEKLNFTFDESSLLSSISQISQDRMFMIIDNRWLIYDEKNDRFREIEIPGNLSYTEPRKTVIACRDLQGRIVFNYRGYIFRLNEDESITLLWDFPEKGKNIISSLFMDRTGTLWVGINTGGLYRINTLIPSFNSRSYTHNFVVDLLLRDMSIDSTEIPASWFQQKGSYDFRYHYSDENRLFFSMDGIYFGRKNRLFFIDDNAINQVRSPQSIRYFRGIYHHDGILTALDTEGGFYTWTNLLELPGTIQLVDSALVPNTGLADYCKVHGQDWILSPENLLYRKVKDSVLEYKVGDPNYSLIAMYHNPASKGIIWISTYGGGILKWNTIENKIEKSYTSRDGLPDNTVAAMVPDKFGNLWLSTFNGISRFDPVDETFTNYFTSDGLIQSEFDRYHGFRLPDGRIAFGGSEGYSVFDPGLFTPDSTNPSTRIVNFLINDQPQGTTEGTGINALHELELAYDQNSLSFTMAAMQYVNPAKIEYRYKIEGFNENWVITGNNRQIRFDNLQPGNYELLLNASNTNNKWSSAVTRLSINISPPWWLSWWAYSLYFALAVLFIFLYWKAYRNKLIRKQQEEFNRREATRLKELDDIKTRFFSNITHEFRTPLTLILSPLQKQLRENKYPNEIQKILESNYRQGSHLLKLVNELLDISKLEAGYMHQNKSTGLLEQFGQECIKSFDSLARQKNIHLSYHPDNVNGYYQFDKSHWQKIISNLLSNAIKFTAPEGTVSLHLAEFSDSGKSYIKMIVKDTGIGISETEHTRLFDRFYQADDSSTRKQEGTGIGLALVKELTELMEGKVTVKSEKGKGSTFTVCLPVEKLTIKEEKQNLQLENRIPHEKAGNDKALILVVEDNPELRAFIVDSLPSRWEVLEATNGKEGHKILLDHLPEIVISDIMMPEMDGYELCQLSKRDPRTSHIHFILLTAKTAQESKVTGLKMGADDYLTKPFQMYELELRVQNALQKQAEIRNKLTSEILSIENGLPLPKVEDIFLSKLYQFIESNLTDKSINVERMASAMAMSQSTLNRKLKSLLNLSAVELLKQYRLKKATELLATGDAIANVAYKSGFESASYFSQCFKESYNVSPSEFQRNLIDRKS